MPTGRPTLTVRLPQGATDDGPVATALAKASKRWWPDGPHPRLWTETVPAPADSEKAARRRETETRRPLGPGQRLRVLLLRYEEEGAGESGGGLAGAPASATAQGTVRTPVPRTGDLVLVADPSALDATSLQLISRVLCGELGPHEVRTAEYSPAARPARVPDPVALRRAAATALVLGRYEGRSSVRVAVPVSALDRSPHTLGAFDGRAVLEADLSEDRTVADLLATPLGSPGDDVIDDAIGGSAPSERHISRVQDQLATLPLETPLVDLVLLDETESAEQLSLGRPPHPAAPPPPPSRRIDEAFADQVALRPDAPALTCGEHTLTYRELDSRADELAAGLRARGVRPGDHVGLCLPRSTDLVAMMLAVLRADAVYVPLDPDHPADRRARSAEDAGLRLTVEDTAPLTGHPAGRRASAARPAPAPAYVIHTSGSTGRPKGVVVPHANVLALIDATRDDFRLGPGDTWTLFHSSAFDFSVWEIWGALLTGARLVVVDYWVSRSPVDFHALLVREGVTVLSQTPSAFTQLMATDREHRGQGRPLALRLVVLGGEPLDARPLRDWFDRHPEDRCRLVNMFGITETTVHVTAQTVTRRTAMSGSRSVGRPLPGWYVYVLDARGRPVPPGAPGEIHVGGAGVATGYLGRPDLTGQRFVPDPWHGGRMYRSGDLGRLLPDGTLEHLGRIDSQVKVRGFRIELDEIRHVLLADPSVSAAAVTVSGDALLDAAGVRIDAFVVLAADPVGAADDIRRRAAKLLPEHMLPASVTALPQLPLTPNGKLDPSRLPAPTAPADAPLDIPSGPFAELTGIWESVLGVPVGPDDNFFDLGGNSLYAIRLATAMRERGLPPVSLRRLYLSPTVRSLSEAEDE
ncbi:amino acid adenylation domain-containing protein [Streptomyces sp. NPDC005181]|uniref:amino acid adenylation domain-containing protein n=1 Tax=Streptomyces sp. NPDC005181 TaxID=3156869 RepID=UPI00339DD2CD